MTSLLDNAHSWKCSPQAAEFGGYAAWEDAQLHPLPKGSIWTLPVFCALRPTPGGPADLRDAIDAILALKLILLGQDERDFLVTEADNLGKGWPHEVRIVGYVRREDLRRMPAYCTVLHVGAPIPMLQSTLDGPSSRRNQGFPASTSRPEKTGRPHTTIAAIDDGIAFLNARFRNGPTQTRIQAIWLQAPEGLDPGGVICGRTLSGAEIDELLAGGEREVDIYRAINRTLRPGTERQSTHHRASHGTHVLDLAAGAAPQGATDADMRAFPILAVQLPPAALRDTSGRRLEGYVVQGLRWLIAQNLRQAAGAPPGPLVVNLSLGSLAGPGDETAFLADWLKHEVDRYARLAPGAVLRIVAAYGNARRARVVARAELRAARDLALDWCILPDDHTPSFLEMRADTQQAGLLRLVLQTPDSMDEPLDIPWPEPGENWTLGNPVRAMVTGVAEDGRRMVQISTAPTAGAGTTNAPGRWHVRIASRDEAPALISLRVQRDDTPAGYRTLGRQSWLDHPLGWEWDDETRDWTAPQATKTPVPSPITREGTAVAFGGTNTHNVFFVGAVRPRPGKGTGTHPALYTGSGVFSLRPMGESTGPTLAALGDDGAILSGRRASGVLSGTTARLSGTSVAAPAVTRALALYLENAATDTTPERELEALLGLKPASGRDALVGFGVLALPETGVLTA